MAARRVYATVESWQDSVAGTKFGECVARMLADIRGTQHVDVRALEAEFELDLGAEIDGMIARINARETLTCAKHADGLHLVSVASWPAQHSQNSLRGGQMACAAIAQVAAYAHLSKCPRCVPYTGIMKAGAEVWTDWSHQFAGTRQSAYGNYAPLFQSTLEAWKSVADASAGILPPLEHIEASGSIIDDLVPLANKAFGGHLYMTVREWVDTMATVAGGQPVSGCFTACDGTYCVSRSADNRYWLFDSHEPVGDLRAVFPHGQITQVHRCATLLFSGTPAGLAKAIVATLPPHTHHAEGMNFGRDPNAAFDTFQQYLAWSGVLFWKDAAFAPVTRARAALKRAAESSWSPEPTAANVYVPPPVETVFVPDSSDDDEDLIPPIRVAMVTDS